jgi:hypothetical protein
MMFCHALALPFSFLYLLPPSISHCLLVPVYVYGGVVTEAWFDGATEQRISCFPSWIFSSGMSFSRDYLYWQRISNDSGRRRKEWISKGIALV